MTRIPTDQPAARGHPIASQARWSAILAGVAVTLALICFLHLVGLAIGVSIIDISDAQAVGAGLGAGAVIWTILSWLAALFLGAMLTARLSGEANESVGLLNGVTFWATTCLLVTTLAVTGVTSAVSGAFSAAGTAVSASASTVGSAVTATGGTIGSAVSDLTRSDSAVLDEVSALLKQEASEAAAGDNGPSAEEIRRSIDQLDAEAIRQFTAHVIDGDNRAAARALADDIALSARDLEDLVERASTAIQQAIGTAGNNQPLTEDVTDQVKSALASRLAELDAGSEPEVSRADIRAALDDLDAGTMQTVAWRLVRGNADGARDALIANTALTRDEADALVTGVENDVQRTADRFREEVREYADEAGDYAQGVLWLAVLTATLGLGASALGGWLGTRPIRR